MPIIATEPLRRAGCYIVSEAEGTRSRDIVVIQAGANVPVGRPLGRLANGKFVSVNPAASDGSQTAIAISFDTYAAQSADVRGVAHTRDAEVNVAELDFGAYTAPQILAIRNQLALVGIICREAA